MPYRIAPDRDLPLVDEFMAAPTGFHSPNLQRLLRAMRGGPVPGKYALYKSSPGREWMLMRLSGSRDVPPTMHEDVVFSDLEEAERHVFRLRWKQMTGRDLEWPSS
ncbi:MAG: hypothetical protein J4G15_05295 [Alphaproteobacteria bacterium]|nr:hypothetical protein [Alphaproteobacteria bacterium]